jgi:hypothetical protein
MWNRAIRSGSAPATESGGAADWRRRAPLAIPVLVYLLVALVQGCALIGRRAIMVYMASEAHSGDVTILLRKSFIERYKNRVTMDATLRVEGPIEEFPSFLDGDLHFEGPAREAGFPCVAEIANAASHKEAVELVRRASRTRSRLNVSGAWRLWVEHGVNAVQTPGEPQPEYLTANPRHVFEIHPVTRIDSMDLLDSLRPVKGYKAGEARRTFGMYEKTDSALRVGRWTVSIVTKPGLYNDVEFLMQLIDEKPRVVDDGRFVMASAMALDGSVVARRVRLVLVKGSDAEKAVRRLKPGERLHVVGLPRLNLEEISRRMRAAGKARLLLGPLPYEIVVYGVYSRGTSGTK